MNINRVSSNIVAVLDDLNLAYEVTPSDEVSIVTDIPIINLCGDCYVGVIIDYYSCDDTLFITSSFSVDGGYVAYSNDNLAQLGEFVLRFNADASIAGSLFINLKDNTIGFRQGIILVGNSSSSKKQILAMLREIDRVYNCVAESLLQIHQGTCQSIADMVEACLSRDDTYATIIP